ncbi:NADP-dependent oxidoreductase [Chitinophaga agrisoli]|uniref:NADP-dependent oxidoreductase n=1 Tax=Chitinophaga agrisoli TaxID=2607653 RepID=A0A5B2VHH7_9BACT|nr:NADP-dependent oxidoreductase [Chitinophaga agrisoli]KAA2238581.1 NADP-dependent oxidoreductase [Chitinophaga agrisoli]
MKAIAVSAFKAAPEVMDLPQPQLRPGTVLVRVAAAGINPFDWKLADGILDGHMPHQFPLIMGVEGAGTVMETGEGVTRFKKGDKIYGIFFHSPAGEGSYAEYAIVPEDAAINHAPTSIPLETAAGAGNAGMTGLQLLEKLGLQKGQTLLVIGATGGVGSFVVQLAALQGLQVIATVSSEEGATRMQELGAATTINYKQAPVVEQVKQAFPEGIDGLIDVISNKADFEAAVGLVKQGGAALTTAFVADKHFLQERQIHGGNFETKGTPASLAQLTQLIDKGQIKVPLDNIISPEETGGAIAQSRAARSKGKTVIKF